ncbi:MAG: hypothetical protein MUF25_04600, partial [Pirellulaceae bacterium]|nr:hypothetical protein [Pirellulaceae bacterium]
MSSEQQSTPASTSRSGPASWRQGRGAGVERRTEYRWQQPVQPTERRPLLTRRRFWTSAWLLLALGLLVALIVALLFAPRRSPLIAVTAVYDESLPPNAWVHEDLAALQQLDRSTLRVYGNPDDWTSRERGLRLLDEHLQRISGDIRADEPLLLYVNMHGAVDGSGTPCLIPPGAAAERSESWLPVSALFERLKDPASLPAEVNKLVILDCTRLRVHWGAGILDNTFAARLSEAVRAADVPNLAVLCATSPGETSWVSPEFSGSVFGHFLSLALAGEANGEWLGLKPDSAADGQPAAYANEANGPRPGFKPDNRVSLHELRAYLEHSVNAWARQHRGETQRPMLLPADAPDFPVCLALKKSDLRSFRDALKRTTRADSQQAADMDGLWSRHDDLLAQAPYREDPLGWHEFERRLLWLEQAVAAGEAYTSPAHSLLNQLKRYRSGDAGPAARQAPVRPVYDATVARRLGTMDATTAANLQELLTRFAEQPSAVNLQAAVAGWPADGPAAHFAQRHFLRILARYEDPEWWRQPEVFRRCLSLRTRAAELGVPGDRSLFYWLRARIQAGDAARQTGEDCLLAGDPASAEARDGAWSEAEGHYQAAGEIADLVGRASRTRDQAYAQLPSLAQWFFRPAATEAAGLRVDNQKRVVALVAQVQQLSEALDQHPATEGDSALGQPGFRGLAEQVERELNELRQAALARGQELSDLDPASSEANVAAVRDIECLLEIALVPASLRSRLRDRHATIALTAAASPAVRLPGGASAGNQDQAGGEQAVQTVAGYPLLKILRLAGSAAEAAPPEDSGAKPPAAQDALAAIEGQGERVRRVLDALAAQNQANLAERLAIADGGSDAAGTEHVAARTALSQAACLVRAAAPIGLPLLDPDPVAVLADFDLQQLLIWHARRAVDDFWGPAGAGEPAFFELAATGYFQAADQLLRRHPTTQRQFDRLQTLLESARSAAHDGIAITATDLLLVKDDEPGIGAIDVRRTDGIAGQAMPAGRLGIWFRDQRGRITTSARTLPTAGLTATAEKVPYTMPGESLAGRGPQLEAVAMIRGHEFTKPSLLRLLGGATVDFQPQQHTTATVTLYGARRKEASTLFILDCSHSMNAPLAVEAP